MADIIRKFQYHGHDALLLPAEREAFVTLQTWLSGIADELELPENTRKKLLIAADEIFTNIAAYGYPGSGGTAEVEVTFNITRQLLTMKFIDAGIAYNPLESPPPDLTKPLTERSIGGLGIFMVKKLMDTVAYKRENDRNILILEKHLLNREKQK
ncbi:MAG: ATP-binding protein [Victivallaceae bacterium]|nr:ATP-binding protein [Victivallaceae bacterium]